MIGLLDRLFPLLLAKVITLVLVLRHSIETRSKSEIKRGQHAGKTYRIEDVVKADFRNVMLYGVTKLSKTSNFTGSLKREALLFHG